MIPLFKPALNQQEINAVSQVLKSGWIGTGPKVEQFEKKFAQFVGVKYAVAVSSASSALQLALQSLSLRPGDQVISPSLTFVATNHSILLNRLVPVFADVDPETFCLDPADIAQKITFRTKAVIVMHYGGHPADLEPIKSLCRKHHLTLIEDCAHAAGSYYQNRHVGGFGQLGCFSFAAIKNLTTGDGGMIVTNNKKLADRLKILRWSGISKETWQRASSKKYSWQYDVVAVSGKHQMNDIAAAIGLVQLAKLKKNNQKRYQLTQTYNQALKNISWLKTPVVKPWAQSSHHNYAVKVPAQLRHRLIDHLAKKNIGTSVHYFPNHHYRMYQQFASHLPVTQEVWQQLLLLPLFPTMTQAQQRQVIKAIKNFKP